jgi:predicted transcriptional regulator
VADGTPDLSDDLVRSRDQATDQARVLALTARIVAAHLAHNPVASPELPALIHGVYASLVTVGATASGTAGSRGLVPAVPVNRSVFPDYIVCLENGLRFRTLRRHLMAAFGLTPEQYRRRWGLPHDYPMIAPSYARNRSGVAKATGLGRTTRPRASAARSDNHGSS